MSQKTRAALKTGLTTYFPDNTSRLITPVGTRTQHGDEIDSNANLIDDNEFQGLNNFTGGLQIDGEQVVALPSTNLTGGFFDYNDSATALSPISVTSGTSPVLLTNDGLGPVTNSDYPPPNVTDLWDTSTNSFDWSELKLGDMVDIRIDVSLTTTITNTEVKIDLHLGTGAGAYVIPFVPNRNFKNTGTYGVNTYNGIYIGDANTLNNGGQLKISSDKDCSVVVNGWYIKALVRG